MLTQTSRLALRLLLFLVQEGSGDPVPLSRIQEALEGSAPYWAKVVAKLTSHRILQSFRGSQGGVSLGRDPKAITLLEVMEACQGRLMEDYCGSQEGQGLRVCAFHEAMVEASEGMKKTLSKWTLADLARRPLPQGTGAFGVPCRMRN